MEAILILEDGQTFYGQGFGAKTTAIGEVVFNTGMTGYQEVLTDPSYKGQMVIMTYPHIGNYGINPHDMESSHPHVEGFIVREFCSTPSNYRSLNTLDRYLRTQGIPGISGIDTRALTRHIREKGSMMGILSTNGTDKKELEARLRSFPKIIGRDLVQYVTIKNTMHWGQEVSSQWYYDSIQPLGEKRFRVLVYDFGCKWNILRLLFSFGMNVTAVPANTPAEFVLEQNPEGVFLSNGPGDPEGVPYAIENVRKLIGKKPIFGICLGHQILALALGARTYKLKFGHHGSNHPVRHEATQKIEITAQNHNFAVDAKSAEKAGLEITHLNLNDGTVEGMRHRELPLFSVQYHPEASPGPHDSLYLFQEFYRMMETHS